MSPTRDADPVSLPIVVADDDIDIRELLSHRLEMAGYSVMTASDGVQALSLIREVRPRLVLLDVSMPQLSGLEVLQVLKSENGLAIIPVILLTGRSDHEEVARGRQFGAIDYVVKPFSVKDLVLRIAEIV